MLLFCLVLNEKNAMTYGLVHHAMSIELILDKTLLLLISDLLHLYLLVTLFLLLFDSL